jgi:putative ABC transport system permease protein
MPAFRLASTSVSETLNHSGRGEITSITSAWSRSALLVGEVALSLMLLFGAGLLLRSFSQLNAVDLGFDKERVLTFVISLPDARYDADAAVRFFDELETRVGQCVGKSDGAQFGRRVIQAPRSA